MLQDLEGCCHDFRSDAIAFSNSDGDVMGCHEKPRVARMKSIFSLGFDCVLKMSNSFKHAKPNLEFISKRLQKSVFLNAFRYIA